MFAATPPDPGAGIASTERAAAWELRAAWARHREVVVVLDRQAGRVRGFVEHVSATNAYALVWDGHGTVHLPCALVRAVRVPHEHETAWGEPVAPPPPRSIVALPYVHPDQLALPVGDCRPDWWAPDTRAEDARAEFRRRRVAKSE